MIIDVRDANSSYDYEDGTFNIEYIERNIKEIKEEAVNYYEIDLRDAKTYDEIIYKLGNVVFKNPKNGKTIVTDVPINTYRR